MMVKYAFSEDEEADALNSSVRKRPRNKIGQRSFRMKVCVMYYENTDQSIGLTRNINYTTWQTG